MTKGEIIEQLIVAEAELKAAQKAEGMWSADYSKPLSLARAKAWQKAFDLRKAAGVDVNNPYGSKPNPNFLNILRGKGR
jgi:hypothetical protein